MLHRVLLERWLSTTGPLRYVPWLSIPGASKKLLVLHSVYALLPCISCSLSGCSQLFSWHCVSYSGMLLFFENCVSTVGYQLLSFYPSYIMCCICAHTKVFSFSSRSASTILPHCSVLSCCSSLIAFEIGVIVTHPKYTIRHHHHYRIQLLRFASPTVHDRVCMLCNACVCGALGRVPYQMSKLFYDWKPKPLGWVWCFSYVALLWELAFNNRISVLLVPSLVHLRCICAHTCSVVASLLGGSLASDSERVAPLRRSCYFFWLFPFYS